MRPLAGIIAGLLLLALVTVALLVPSRDGRASHPTAAPSTPEPAGASRSARLPAIESPSMPERQPVATAAETLPPRRQPVEIHATVIGIEPAGAERRDLSGHASVVFYEAANGAAIGVETGIEHGQFRVLAPAEATLETIGIEPLVLDGSLATITNAGTNGLPLDADHRVEIRAALVRTILHVVDAATRRELSEVTVVHDGDYTGFSHPGIYPEADVVTRHGASPIVVPLAPQLEEGNWKETVYATAPGCAWASTDVEHDQGHEYTIALHPGGDLEIVLVGHEALHLEQWRKEPEVLARPRLSIDRVKDARFDGTTSAPETDLQSLVPIPESGSCTLTGLLPGRYLVTAEIGDGFELGRAETEIDAGHRSAVSIALAAPPPTGTLVPLAGTLFVPPAWGDVDPILFFSLEGRDDLGGRYNQFLERKTMTRVDGSPGLYRWDCGKVPPGTYDVSATGLQTEFEVGPKGNDRVALAIVEPADVRVRVLDLDTGLDADVMVGNERPDPATHLFTLRLPSGEQGIELQGMHYGWQCSRCLLVPGPNEITIRVGKLVSVRLELADRGQFVAWPRERALQVTDEHGQEVTWHATFGDDCELAFAEPGRYRITLPAIAGFDPVEPFEVEVRRGETITRTIALRRAP